MTAKDQKKPLFVRAMLRDETEARQAYDLLVEAALSETRRPQISPDTVRTLREKAQQAEELYDALRGIKSWDGLRFDRSNTLHLTAPETVVDNFIDNVIAGFLIKIGDEKDSKLRSAHIINHGTGVEVQGIFYSSYPGEPIQNMARHLMELYLSNNCHVQPVKPKPEGSWYGSADAQP